MGYSIKCPNCNSVLSISDDDRVFAFCQYCGTKLFKTDSERHIDLAFEKARNRADAIAAQRRQNELDDAYRRAVLREKRHLHSQQRADRLAKVLGKILLVPGWLLSIYFIWNYCIQGDFSSVVLGIVLLLIDVFVGGIAVIILLVKKW